jgi:hypothetical protein
VIVQRAYVPAFMHFLYMLVLGDHVLACSYWVGSCSGFSIEILRCLPSSCIRLLLSVFMPVMR